MKDILPPYSDSDREAIRSGQIKFCEEFSKPGIPETDLKKMRSGKVEVQDECDLHGLKAREVHAELESFLRDALSEGLKTVDVCHGKGLHAADIPVIGPLVRHWLRQSKVVLAFVSPAGNKGMARVRLKSLP